MGECEQKTRDERLCTYLANNVARLHRADRLEVAAHRSFVVALAVEVITISANERGGSVVYDSKAFDEGSHRL